MANARVSTPAGGLQGIEARGATAFLGIPYAAPPIGALRFRHPAPAVRWAGTRDARRFGPAAPQADLLPPPLRRLPRVAPAPSEDCLYLNVWTPGADRRRRPVLVWIHGGGFTRGAASWFMYDGNALARNGDLVVVSLNYRLGLLGAFNLECLAAPSSVAPNLGLHDQLAALRWVRENAEALGGDPEQVTVAGQSAGAMSIASLLCADTKTLPDGDLPFQRAVLQSGAASNVLDTRQAMEVTELALRKLELEGGERLPDPERADLLAERLRALPVEILVRAQRRVSFEHRLPLGTMAWQPSVDGVLLRKRPFETRTRSTGASAQGWPRPRPLLIGTTLDEWKLFTATDPKRRKLDATTLAGYVQRTLPGLDATGHSLAERALELYRHDAAGAARSPAEQWVALQSDRVFRYPASRLADAMAVVAPVHAYRFDWRPLGLRRRLGAFHSIEIPFLFGTHRHPGAAPVLMGPGAAEMARQVQGAWIAFTRCGDPRCDAVPQWPRYATPERETLLLDVESRVASAPGEEERRFWAEVRSLRSAEALR